MNEELKENIKDLRYSIKNLDASIDKIIEEDTSYNIDYIVYLVGIKKSLMDIEVNLIHLVKTYDHPLN